MKEYHIVNPPYHKLCANIYVLKGERAMSKKRLRTHENKNETKNRTRASFYSPFDAKIKCFFCEDDCNFSPNPKHLDRWRLANQF